MKLATIGTSLLKVTGRTGLQIQKHSPTILMVVGIGSLVGAAVMACRSTLKVDAVLDEHREKVEKIHTVREEAATSENPKFVYSEKDSKKDLVTVYARTAFEFIKLYGPSVVLGAAGIACIIGGNRIMTKRNLAMAAAYKAVEEGFKEYRKRVVDEFGSDKDFQFKHGLKAEEVDVLTKIDEDGKETTEKMTILTADDPNKTSQYARFFDDGCAQWTKNSELNLYFLRAQQNYFNDLLKARGHVFLNEVYDALGIPRSQAGQVVGWVLGAGDDFIDFGLTDTTRQGTRDFVNGYERSILLDFNVDGLIYDKI